MAEKYWICRYWPCGYLYRFPTGFEGFTVIACVIFMQKSPFQDVLQGQTAEVTSGAYEVHGSDWPGFCVVLRWENVCCK